MPDDPADLRNLHDIVVPDEVPWWPPAPGWIALLVVLAVVVLVLAVLALRRWRADAYRRAALRELEAAGTSGDVAAILRRTALVVAPRETIASLHGTEWTRWLSERSPEAVPEELQPALTGALYDEDRSSGNLETLRGFARRWIRQHTRPC